MNKIIKVGESGAESADFEKSLKIANLVFSNYEPFNDQFNV